MPRSIRFHLDENAPKAAAIQLRLRGVDVTTTMEAGLLTAEDSPQLDYCNKTGRVLFTSDTDFLAMDAAGHPHPGIIYIEKSSATVGRIVRGILDVWEILDSADMADRVEFM